MIFGCKETFAVEVNLDKDYGGSWLFGQFCYWINNVQVGDYVLGTSLRDVLLQMKWIVKDAGNRDGGVLCDFPPQQVFKILDECIYESGESAISQELQPPDSPARYDIKIPVDVFDDWKVYLLQCGDRALMLFNNIYDKDIRAVTLPTGVFENVIEQVHRYLDDLYTKEDRF